MAGSAEHLMKHSEKKRRYITWAALILGAAILAAAALFDWDGLNSYTAVNNSTLSYVRAVVVQVDAQELERDEADSQLWLGSQELTVRILEGEKKGEQVELTNYLTRVHCIYVTQGQRIILCADLPENAEPYYTVYNYDRTLPLGLLVAAFALAVLLVGRGKGLRALLGVTYSLLTIILLMVQAIYHGFTPWGAALLTVLLISGVSLLLLNGISRQTAVGLSATLAGVAATALIFLLFSRLLHLSGYNTDDAETLLMAGDSTGMSIRYLLLAGVMISALGAVMDVAVSLAAALKELVQADPAISRRALMRSGLNIGKDMIATMSNTLILAFAGTGLNTMLCLLAYGYQPAQLLSSDYLAVEMAQGLCATLGVVLTVPVTIAIAAGLYIGGSERQSRLSGGVNIKKKKLETMKSIKER